MLLRENDVFFCRTISVLFNNTPCAQVGRKRSGLLEDVTFDMITTTLLVQTWTGMLFPAVMATETSVFMYAMIVLRSGLRHAGNLMMDMSGLGH